mmetsp:Transcript_26120/g.65837  ORF Transcript_26120/g.65837 Transcript_26120/m.65837 type:complete len:218 (+) Transcript_26120:197-850(+)
MNIFRFCGDMLHLASILLLLWKIHKNKSCVGVSCRMQEMYLLVFCLRYLDLLYEFISLYNSCMKIFFIISTGYLIYLMRYKPPVNQTYDRTVDSFKYELYFVGPALLLGVLTCEEYSITEILWSSSIFLEAVSITPQLVLLAKMREVENLTSHFVAAMGLYRAFYILNWIYKYLVDQTFDPVAILGGVVQTVLYCDFFYYYAMSKWYGNRLVLPMAT